MVHNTRRAFLLSASRIGKKKQTSSRNLLQEEDAAIANQLGAQNRLSAYANVKYLTTVSATCWKTALLAALVVTFLFDSFHLCQV